MRTSVSRVARWLVLPFRVQPRGRVAVPSRGRRIGGVALVLSAVTFVILAVIYGLGGEWRSVGFFSFIALGFWLGAQEVVG